MLTDRQRMILNAIVDDYIRSAEPVGSRSISKRGDVGFSPATIRNEMADLEELGFWSSLIRQPEEFRRIKDIATMLIILRSRFP